MGPRSALGAQEIRLIPYTAIVGQEKLKLALELAYVAPRIGGSLISGHRGTCKSTAVRAFSCMMSDDGRLPVTLPINATEDRVVGGWQIDELMRGKPQSQKGLLEEADGGLLYVDEVNLLDDHIVNIILDVTSTNILVIQREGRSEQKHVEFTLVGTMNPEEGGLRPQLLDRFGLMVNVTSETDPLQRMRILQTVLEYDKALRVGPEQSPMLQQGRVSDQNHRQKLREARQSLDRVELPDDLLKGCVRIALDLKVEGHRADFVLALAARACAALEGSEQVAPKHVAKIAPLALQHRRAGAADRALWGPREDETVKQCLGLRDV
jgi:magnesium chelatase subunit I